jgi:hypothetical protein
MQNYVNLNIDYVNFNRGGGVNGDDGLGGGLSLGLGGGEKGEKGEKNRKSGEINNNAQKTNNTINTINTNHGELVYKTIVMPFYIPLVDYVILNDFFIEIIDSLSNNQVLGEGKIRKYRLNGPPTNYDMFVETEKENVYHVKKRGIMMRVKVSGDQYKTIVKMLTSLNDGGVGVGVGSSSRDNTDHNVHNVHNNNRNVLIKKKTGFFSWLACFRAV